MSGENPNVSAHPLPPYTVYSAKFQNSGFYDCHSQAPPPKYEDVISGEYLNPNYSSWHHPSPAAGTPACQSVDLNSHCTCTRINTAELLERSSDEDEKKTKCGAECFFLVTLIGLSLLIWRIYFR